MPRTVFLLTVRRSWALLVAVTAQLPTVAPVAKGVYVRDVKVDEQLVH